MTSLAVEVTGARVEPHAASPTIMLGLELSVDDGSELGALALRCQVRIEPQRRRYSPEEGPRLHGQFGAAAQWAESLRPFLWTHTSTVVPQFAGSTSVELPLVCTYDLEVAGTSYLDALDDGVVPLVLLFSGTMFRRGPTGLSVELVPWDLQASYPMPVAVWRQAMEACFPNAAWLRVGHDTFRDLQRFRASRGLPTWDLVVERLLAEAGELVP